MAYLLTTKTEKADPEQLVNMIITGVAAAVTNPEVGKMGWLYQTTQSDCPSLWGMNVRIMPKEIRLVSEEEDNNYDTMAEGEERYNECVWMNGEDEPPDDLMYNGVLK